MVVGLLRQPGLGIGPERVAAGKAGRAPVGGLVARAREAGSIHERFCEHAAVAVRAHHNLQHEAALPRTKGTSE